MIPVTCATAGCWRTRADNLGDAARALSLHRNAKHGAHLRGDDLADALHRAQLDAVTVPSRQQERELAWTH